MALKFRKAEISDVKAILDIEKSAADKYTYSPILDEQEVKEYILDENVYLIYFEDKVVGSISYKETGGNHAHIGGLVVYPKYQRQGIGTEAIKWILNELKDYKKVSLVTHPDNANALKIYQKAGFKKGKVIENYFGDGQPRVELIKIKSAF